jgi:hypothetical protein
MEILPHFWVTHFNEKYNIIVKKKINNIIYLSKYEKFVKRDNIEQIRIPFDYDIDGSIDDMNINVYQHLFDITDYIHEKICNNENILLIGYIDRQDIDVVIISYFIRFGKMTLQNAINILKSKKDDIFNPKCLFFSALNKFYNELNKFN